MVTNFFGHITPSLPGYPLPKPHLDIISKNLSPFYVINYIVPAINLFIGRPSVFPDSLLLLYSSTLPTLPHKVTYLP